MKGILNICLILAMMGLAACHRETGLEKMAMRRLPVGLEKAVRERWSYTDVRVERPLALYDCDSLCIIQCMGVAKDAQGETVQFPVRYAFLLDVVMSAAEGHRVYCESVMGGPVLDEEEIRKTREVLAEKGTETYRYYLAASTNIEDSLP